MKQTTFKYDLLHRYEIEDFFVSESNKKPYNFLFNNNNNNNKILLIGPNKSGKTHLGKIWLKKYNALNYSFEEFENLIKFKRNIFIDNFLNNINEEHIFHLINHINLNKLNILLTSNNDINKYNFLINDLTSRIKTFDKIYIQFPDDNLIINIMIKLFHDKRIIINNTEILNYILKRIERTYEGIFFFIEKVDKLSLEKKRELTIPLIKELL